MKTHSINPTFTGPQWNFNVFVFVLFNFMLLLVVLKRFQSRFIQKDLSETFPVVISVIIYLQDNLRYASSTRLWTLSNKRILTNQNNYRHFPIVKRSGNIFLWKSSLQPVFSANYISVLTAWTWPLCNDAVNQCCQRRISLAYFFSKRVNKTRMCFGAKVAFFWTKLQMQYFRRFAKINM